MEDHSSPEQIAFGRVEASTDSITISWRFRSEERVFRKGSDGDTLHCIGGRKFNVDRLWIGKTDRNHLNRRNLRLFRDSVRASIDITSFEERTRAAGGEQPA
ncbi:hypothetical protein SUGI_0841900 [Cryptomeria japonica]|nr:hypothetical protein SUGI_0841900 [Cryptomeria japonica]